MQAFVYITVINPTATKEIGEISSFSGSPWEFWPAPTHCLQDNSPLENVLAMYETARKCGTY